MGEIKEFPISNVPGEPDWEKIYQDPALASVAHDHWREIVSAMVVAGTISPATGHAIQRLVFFRIEHDAAARDVALHGRLASRERRVGKSKSPFNPAWTVMRQTEVLIQKLEADLALSPRHRDKAGKAPKPSGPSRKNPYLPK